MSLVTILTDALKGVANGIAELNASVEVPDAQISSSSVTQHSGDIQNLGTKIIQDSEDAVDSTSSTSPQLAWTTTKTLETAKYKVEYQMEMEGDGITSGFTERCCFGSIEIDSVEVARFANLSSEYSIQSGIFFLDATAGDYDFDFYFWSETGTSVNVRRKRLIISKVVE